VGVNRNNNGLGGSLQNDKGLLAKISPWTES